MTKILITKVKGIHIPKWAVPVQGDFVSFLGDGFMVRAELSPMQRALLALIPGLIVLIAWETYGRLHGSLYSIPPFSWVLYALFDLLTSAEIYLATLNTLVSFFVGFAGSILIGLPLGIAMGLSLKIQQFFQPFVALLLTAPFTAMIPIFIIFFGIGLISKIFVVFFFGLMMILLNTLAATRDADGKLVEMARSFQASRKQLIFKVILPCALPGIFAGIYLGAGRAIVGMIVAEFLLVSSGLGGLLLGYRELFQNDYLTAVTLVMVLIGLLITHLVRRLERKILRYK